MVKEELVEGIRQAISKGEPIEKAMMSFYNSGYSKQDIEEAAAMAQSPGFFQPVQQPRQPMPAPQTQVQQPLVQQPLYKPQPAQQQTAVPQPQFQYQPQQQVQPGVVQRVSAYGPKPSGKGMAITIVLVVILLLLIGLLAAVIIFKDEISDFLSGAWRVFF